MNIKGDLTMRFFLLYAIIIIITGCTSTSKYIDDSSIDTNNNVRIHLKRPLSFAGGGNAILVVDAGLDAKHNGVIARSPSPQANSFKRVYYVGPESNKEQKQWGNKPIIGSFTRSICGVKPEDLHWTGIADYNDFTCPTKPGMYEIYTSWKNDFIHVVKNHKDSQLYFLTGSEESITKLSKINFIYEPVSIIGELANSGNIIWTRPVGTLKLYSIGCGLSCGGENSSMIIAPPLIYPLESGKEYYIHLNLSGFEISDKPIKSDVLLSADEVRDTFSGKTADWEHYKEGYSATGYFDPNGTLKGLKNGSELFERKWSVNEEGELCIHKNSNKSCRIIERSGSEYKKYKFKYGTRKHIVTYKNYVDGNPNNF